MGRRPGWHRRDNLLLPGLKWTELRPDQSFQTELSRTHPCRSWTEKLWCDSIKISKFSVVRLIPIIVCFEYQMLRKYLHTLWSFPVWDTSDACWQWLAVKWTGRLHRREQTWFSKDWFTFIQFNPTQLVRSGLFSAISTMITSCFYLYEFDQNHNNTKD